MIESSVRPFARHRGTVGDARGMILVMSEIIYCEGCGEPVEIDRQHGATYMREKSGRMTWYSANLAVHQCADGNYLPDGEIAPPKKST